MRRYIRPRQGGADWFVTVVLNDRVGDLSLTDHIAELRTALLHVRNRRSFQVTAMVVLPDHWHAILSLPEGDSEISQRIMLIKSGFSRRLGPIEGPVSQSRLFKRERGIWQRRFHDHVIRNEIDLQHHVNYIHINPVKHGLVSRASDWPYSTIHRYIRNGVLAPDWACEPGVLIGGLE